MKFNNLEDAARFARDALTGYPFDDAHWRDFCWPAIKALEQQLASHQHARQPLTLEQINRIEMATEWPEGSLRNIGPRDWGRLLVCATRAIERAHGIGSSPIAQEEQRPSI